jgi:endogenous inhibitor of DNA gyrase (YacG/DUF329 family)
MTVSAKCPTCGAPRAARHRPFCSRRCADIDLGRWFSGRYAVPASEPPEGFDDDSLTGRLDAANDD